MGKFDYYYSPSYMMQFARHAAPYNPGSLTTPDGEKISFMEFGNPQAAPILFLHGGPGGFVQPMIDLAFFNLQTQRVILYNQRHCQTSRTSSNWQRNNETAFLLTDIEQLRVYLGVNSWSIFGGSWGSCLGLCYAIEFPERVNKQIYWGILLGRQSCIDFIAPEMLTPMEAYYCSKKFFLPENFIITHSHLLREKDIALAHGSEDNICSVENARELAQALPQSELFVAEEEGHNPYMPKLFKFLKEKAQNL